MNVSVLGSSHHILAACPNYGPMSAGIVPSPMQGSKRKMDNLQNIAVFFPQDITNTLPTLQCDGVYVT